MENVKFFIIVPYLKSYESSSGTTIRIAGYTRSLEKLGIDYRFLSTVKPSYVPSEKYESLKLNRRWIKIILIHNLLYSKIPLRFLSFPLQMVLDHVAGLKRINLRIGSRFVWSHQENTMLQYLNFRYKAKCIYDIHGILRIQNEYRSDLNPWKKFWFDLSRLHEKIVIKKTSYINVVSEQMSEFVTSTFQPEGIVLLAPDGIPAPLAEYVKPKLKIDLRQLYEIPKTEQIILFAGSFKKFGGVTELIKLFVDNCEINYNTKLVLIGTGQEEKRISNLLLNTDYMKKVIWIRSVVHSELISIMNQCDVIVCPDLPDNIYNQITPHIKFYDAIASGKNVVATDLEVNRRLFDENEFNVFYFSYDRDNSFKDTLIAALKHKEGGKHNRKKLEGMTYLENAKSYLEYFW